MNSTLTQRSVAINEAIAVPPGALFTSDPSIIYLRMEKGAVCIYRAGRKELLGVYADDKQLRNHSFFQNCTICSPDVVVSLSNG